MSVHIVNRWASRRRSRLAAAAVALALAATTTASLVAAGPAQAQTDGVTVDFGVDRGAPVQRASGTLYGLTQDGSNPPDQYLTGIGWNYLRAGGSQLNNPGGWAHNPATYQTRWDSTLAQYQRATSHGAEFVLIVNDLWGRDATWNAPYPGDNGDWSSYDAFLDRLIADVQSSGMTPEWDIWNEPNLSIFWDRPQSQYLEMWQRGFERIRQAFPNAEIVGPSSAGSPPGYAGWWGTYLDFVAANDVVPDIISWHAITGSVLDGDPTVARQTMDGWLAQRGVSPREYQINEYAFPEQQNPAQGGWYISRLERENISGLRANWGSGTGGLHNNLADLLQQSGGGYQTKGEWVLYREYASMGGTRVEVTPGSVVDGFATRDAGAQEARVLLGRAEGTGATTVNLTGLGATGLVEGGQVRALLERVPYNNDGVVTSPVTVSDQNLAVSNGTASLTFGWDDAPSAYLVTLLAPGAETGPIQPGVDYQLVAEHSGLALDIEEASTAAGAAAIQWGSHSGQNQRFRFVATGDGYYRVIAQHSGHALDVSESSPDNGAAVIQWNDQNSSNQHWQVIDHGGGVVSLINRASGKAMDVEEASTASGAPFIQWDYHGAPNQQFQLIAG